MNDDSFHLLVRFASGVGISQEDKDREKEFLTHTDKTKLTIAWSYLQREGLIRSTNPAATAYGTKYAISELGKITLEKERTRRASVEEVENKKMKIEDLQEQLLSLSIKTATSTLQTNKSIQDLNDATQKSLSVQKWLAGAVAFFSLVSVVVAGLTYIRPPAPTEQKKTEVSQPKRQPPLSVPSKPRTAKDSV